MNSQELINNCKLKRIILASATTASGTLANEVDTLGHQGAVMFALNIGTVGAADADNTLKFTFWESDEASTGYTEITDLLRYITPHAYNADTNPHGNGYFVINNTNMADTDHLFGVSIGTKRYIEVRVVEAGTFSGTITLNALLSDPRFAPVTAHRP